MSGSLDNFENYNLSESHKGVLTLQRTFYVITNKYQRIIFIAYLIRNFARCSFPAGI